MPKSQKSGTDKVKVCHSFAILASFLAKLLHIRLFDLHKHYTPHLLITFNHAYYWCHPRAIHPWKRRNNAHRVARKAQRDAPSLLIPVHRSI